MLVISSLKRPFGDIAVMIAKCTFTNAVNSLRLLLLATICSLPACVNGAEISTECRTIIIASVLGTLAACTAVSIGLLIYVCRRARNNAMRGMYLLWPCLFVDQLR